VRLDAHHHVWDDTVRDAGWAAPYPVLHRAFGLTDLTPALVAHEIDGTILVQTRPSYGESRAFLAEADGQPRVIGVVAWADLSSPSLADELDQLLEGQGGEWLLGVRHQVEDEPDPEWLDRPDVRRGLAEVARHGLTYDLLVNHAQMPSAARAVVANPELRFVLDHAGKPAILDGGGEGWRSGFKALALLPNCAVKLSGLVTLAGPDWQVSDLQPYGDELLSRFGPERMMFGSDWPVCLIAAGYDQVIEAAEAMTAGLSAAERELVFGLSAQSWYGR
jgi:L-fuconolactonase